MKLRIDRCFLALLLILTAGGTAHAWVLSATSLEWLTCSAEAIIVGTISEIATSRGPHQVEYETCIVDVRQVLKGDVEGKRIAFTLRRLGASPTVQPLAQSKASVLLFLSKSKPDEMEGPLQDKWVPTESHVTPAIVDLSTPPKKVHAKGWKIVDDKNEVLKIVGEWAKSPIKHSLSLADDQPSFLYRVMTVPAEESYRPQFMALARSAKPGERARAAAELYKFPGDETEAVLRQLLKDDSQGRSGDGFDRLSRVEYFVRSAAYRSLKELGKPVPEVVLEREPTPEEQEEYRNEVRKQWRESFSTAMKDGWSISAADGQTRVLEGRERIALIITCRKGDQQATFTLVPKEWPAGELPETEFLGINGIDSQGARRFFLDGKLPAEVKQQVVAYFGLKK